MKLIYSEIIDSAWKSLRDDLPLVAGLSLVCLFGAWVLNLVPFVGGILALPLWFGFIKCLLQIRQKETIGWDDFFWGFKSFNRFLHLVLLQGLIGLGYLGFILIIPGFWWIAASFFASSYFILRKEDAIESITKSMALVKGRWWNIFGFVMLLALINMAGILCFFIGLLVSAPISALAAIIATEKLLAETEPPAPISGDANFRTVEATVVPQ